MSMESMFKKIAEIFDNVKSKSAFKPYIRPVYPQIKQVFSFKTLKGTKNSFDSLKTEDSKQSSDLLRSEKNEIKNSSTPSNILPPPRKHFMFKIVNNLQVIKPYLFETLLTQKRGRKIQGNGSRRKTHSANDFDNVQRKIQVKYISFLINLANDVITSILDDKNKFHFLEIDYSLKKKIEFKYVEDMKKFKYSDILQMKISPKYKKSYEEGHNKTVFLEITKISPLLKNFFSHNYLYIFQKYYYNEGKPLKEIDINSKIVKITSKTKSFYYLMLNNEHRKEKLNSVLKDIYFSEPNFSIKNLFKTSKYIENFSNNENQEK